MSAGYRRRNMAGVSPGGRRAGSVDEPGSGDQHAGPPIRRQRPERPRRAGSVDEPGSGDQHTRPPIRRQRPERPRRAVNWRGLLLLASLAATWELLPRVGLVDAVLLPPFTRVAGRLVSLLVSGSLWPHVGASVARVLLGYGLALLVALPVGLYIGLRERAEEWLGPLTQLLRPLAPPAWIPLAILWFGIGNTPAIFIIFVGTVLTLLLGTIGAVRGVDKHLVQGALTLGATRAQAVFQVVLPAALPELLTMLRLGLGLAWMCVVAAEMVAVSRGLGFLILEARNTFNTTTVLAGMIAIGLLGLGMDVGLRQLQQRLLRWQAGRKAYGVLGDARTEQGLSDLG